MDAKHMDALRELEIAALRGHPDGYATSDCTVTYKEAADALRAALARCDEADRMETALREHADPILDVIMTADATDQRRIKLDDVIESATHLAVVMEELGYAPK